MNRLLRGTALVLAFAIVLLMGGCSAKETAEPVSTKTLYEQGEELAAEVVEIAGNREYLSFCTDDEKIVSILTQTVEGKDYTAPQTVYSLTLSKDTAEKLLGLLGMEDTSGLPDNLKRRIQERLFLNLPSQINAMSGVEALAATSICTASRVFVNAEVTEDIIYLYTYENGASIAVVFLPGEDGAVSATGTFLLNDDFQMESLGEFNGLLGLLGLEINEVLQ